MIDDTTTCTAAEFGSLLGLTDRRIRQLAADGVIVKQGRGKYLLGESLRGMLSAVEDKSEPDDLRRARVELMTSQKKKLDQEIERRSAMDDDQAWQRKAIDVICLYCALSMRQIGGWLHAEFAGRGVAPDALRDICMSAHQMGIGAAHRLKTDLTHLAQQAETREQAITDFNELLKMLGRDEATLDELQGQPDE